MSKDKARLASPLSQLFGISEQLYFIEAGTRGFIRGLLELLVECFVQLYVNELVIYLLTENKALILKDLLKDLPSPEKRGNTVRFSLQCADFQRKKGEFSALLTSPQLL